MESFNHILQMHLPTEWPRQPLQAEKMNLSFTPHTGLSSIKGRQSPIDHKQPFDFPSGLRNKSIWMGEASRDKENKNRKQKKKKKKAGSERNKITEQLQANSCPHSLLLKHTNWNSPLPWTLPIPMGFRQLREALAKTVSLWRWRRFWELWMPERDSYSLWRQFSQEQGKLAST